MYIYLADLLIMVAMQGLLKAVGELVPRAEHRMCARHIYANWRKKYGGQKLQRKFWRCAKSSCEVIFNYNKAKLAEETPDGATDMLKTAPEHWSRAFFKLGSNCDSVDNNMCESFNNSIMDSRFLPVISMNEIIRRKVMVRIQENRTKAEKWQGTICPNVFKKLKLNIERSGQCHVLWNGQDGFEVKEKDKMRFTVNLDQMTCSCRYWQLSGLPCCHAISAIYMASRSLNDFIHPCFSISEYMKTYRFCLQPVEGQESWPISDMPRPYPPAYVKMPGRKKTKRTKEIGEKPTGTKISKVGVKMRCRLCQKTTHNIRRCPYNKEAGKRKNAHIKRDAVRKRKQSEAATSAPGPSVRNNSSFPFSILLLLSSLFFIYL